MKQNKAGGNLPFKGLGILAGLVFIIAGVNERSQYSRLKRLGEIAIVDPVQDYTEFRRSGNSFYTAQFHFKTADGKDLTIKHSFSEDVLEEMKAGRPVRVFYLRESPEAFVFESDKPSWTMIAGGIALAIAALIFA